MKTNTSAWYAAIAQTIADADAERATAEKTVNAILSLCRKEGAEYPTFAESSDSNPVIMDTASGRTWRVKVEEF